MPLHAVWVRDGEAYSHSGEYIARVRGADGYYPNPVQYPDTIKQIRGELVMGEPLIEEGAGTCISAWPEIKLDGKTKTIEIGRIDDIKVGQRIYLFRQLRNYYYYLPEEDESSTAKLLADWWKKFPIRTPWITIHGKVQLRPGRTKGLVRGHGLAEIVNNNYGFFMTKPDQLQMETGRFLKRSMSLFQRKFDKMLAPIGGKITAIAPAWQQGVAMLWVRFEINGVEPTNGTGCMVYKNGDFYYGPWCQRIRQHNHDDNGSEIMTKFPPKYTLRTWITGPLFATATDGSLGARGPKPFQPTGTFMFATGTAQVDGHEQGDTSLTKSQFDKAAKEWEPSKTAKETKAETAERTRIINSLKRNTFDQQVQKIEGEVTFKIPVEGLRYLRLISNVFLATEDFRHWSLRYEISWAGSTQGKAMYYPKLFEFPIDLDELYGHPDGFVLDNPKVHGEVQHFQLMKANCNCHGCGLAREAVKRTLKMNGVSPKSGQNERTATEILEAMLADQDDEEDDE